MLSNEDMKFGLAILVLGALIGMAIAYMSMGIFDGFIYWMVAMTIALVLTSTLYRKED